MVLQLMRFYKVGRVNTIFVIVDKLETELQNVAQLMTI